MFGFDKENIPKSYTRVPWDAGDRSKYDFGNPESKYSSPYPLGDELDVIAEWERMKIEDTQNDLVITY